MKFCFLFLMLIFSGSVLADDLKIELNPNKPVAGEVFQAYFRIFTDSDEEPNITFTPGGLEVLGKSNQGVSTRTVYANGRLSVSREITVAYDLISKTTGMAYLRDIKVQLGGKVLNHPTIAVSVLKEPEEVPEVFLRADVPKKTVYVGEGIIVRYYLYNKNQISNVDVKKYPKLNNFLKRFIQEPERTERVSVNGELYLRSQIYVAKLFPEKAGELRIDPLEATVTYAQVRANDPFAAFGMNRNFKTKQLASEALKISVQQIPMPSPNHFTGLVGKHDFQVQFGQTKLIVNEPLEVKLTVSGAGALENLEAPALIKHPGLEEFETNGDLKFASADEGTKTFDYTYLAKENFKLPANTITLSYLDSDSGKYVPVTLQIPAIEAAGGAAKNSEPAKPAEDERPVPQKQPAIDLAVKPLELAGPILNGGRNYRTWIPYLNAALAVLSILVALSWVIRNKKFSFDGGGTVPAEFKKGRFEFGQFSRWLSPVTQKTGRTPLAIIRESDLPEDTKTYFIDLLKMNDYKDYSAQKREAPFKYEAAHWKRLSRYIESNKHEDLPLSGRPT